MRHLATLSLLVAGSVFSWGCSTSSPMGVLTTASVVSKPAKVAANDALKLSPESSKTQNIHTESLTPEAPVPPRLVLPEPLPDEASVAEAPAFDLGLLESDGARRLEKADVKAQSLLDPWRPYGLGVVKKTARTITLAWRTDLECKAIVYFGQSFGLSRRGYDGVLHVNKSAKVHQVTIEGLSRFRSYTFTVVGLGPLTTQYPSYPLKTRTHLF